VRAGIGAFVAELILATVQLAVELSDFGAFLDQVVPGLSDDPEVTDAMLESMTALVIVFVVLFQALQAMFIWFAWTGRNWARVVLWVLGGMAVVGLLTAMGQSAGRTGFSSSMDVFRLLCTVAGIALLAQKPAHEWYRYRRWQRANGQG
jgi:hypothetical protein